MEDTLFEKVSDFVREYDSEIFYTLLTVGVVVVGVAYVWFSMWAWSR